MTQGLVIPGSIGIPDTRQQSIEEYWDVENSSYEKLAMMGFDELPKPPCDFPQITVQDYENIEGEQYTQLMAMVDIWFVYAKDKQAWLEGRIIGREEELKDLEREIKRNKRQEYDGVPKKNQPSETELKEEAQSYPRCREIRRELAELRHVEKVIKARIDGCERLASGLSRQVTLRGQNIDLGGRVGGRRTPGPITR